MQKVAKSNRVFYIDLLRVIACLSVIMIHSSARYVVENIGSLNFWIGNILDGISRIGVPLFVMISGALILDKNYEFSKNKLIKHISKMILFFVFWSLTYCMVFTVLEPIILRHETVNVLDVLKSFISGPYHLWFIYMIIGLYLIAPLLRLWVKDKNKKQIEYFIVLSVIFTYIIPQIIYIGRNYHDFFNFLNGITELLQLKYIGGFTTYFILGWYINNYDIKNKKIIYILGFLSLIVTIVGTYILSTTTGKSLQMYENLSINVLFQSLAVFVFIKDKFKNYESKKHKLINIISKYSLGIYAMHVLVITITYKFLDKINCDFALISIPVVYIVSLVFSFIVSFIFSKLPILKKVV